MISLVTHSDLLFRQFAFNNQAEDVGSSLNHVDFCGNRFPWLRKINAETSKDFVLSRDDGNRPTGMHVVFTCNIFKIVPERISLNISYINRFLPKHGGATRSSLWTCGHTVNRLHEFFWNTRSGKELYIFLVVLQQENRALHIRMNLFQSF